MKNRLFNHKNFDYISKEKNFLSATMIIHLTIIYVTLSYLIFRFGPIIYSHRDTNVIILYLIGYMVALKLGTVVAEKVQLPVSRTKSQGNHKLKMLIRVGLIIGIVLSLLNIVNIFGSSPSEIAENIIRGFTNPDEGYLYHATRVRESGIITQLTTLFSPLVLFSFAVIAFLWKETGKLDRTLIVAYIFAEACKAIMIGTNFGLFRLVVIGLIPFFIGMPSLKLKVNRKKMILITILTLSVLIFVVFYFFHSISARLGWTEIPKVFFGQEVNQEHWLMQFPVSISIPLLIGVAYISQGFNGFAIAQLFGFDSTFPFGAGRFLLSLSERFFSSNLWYQTYQARMTAIWHPSINWHTSFTWIANDISFIGVIPYLFFMSFLFCLVYRDAIGNKNPIAISIVPIFIVMFIFLPLNNIVMSTPLLFMPFAVLSFIWLVGLVGRRVF